MASTLAPLPQLPVPTERLADPQTGRVNQNWYQYLKAFDQHIREAEKRIAALGG